MLDDTNDSNTSLRSLFEAIQDVIQHGDPEDQNIHWEALKVNSNRDELMNLLPFTMDKLYGECDTLHDALRVSGNNCSSEHNTAITIPSWTNLYAVPFKSPTFAETDDGEDIIRILVTDVVHA